MSDISSELNSTASVQHKRRTQDTIGGEVLANDGAAVSYDCRIRALSGRERESTGREDVVSTHRIYFVGSADVRGDDEITISAKVYDVSFVNNVDEEGEHLQVDAIRRKE